jgi:hypothetical protein
MLSQSDFHSPGTVIRIQKCNKYHSCSNSPSYSAHFQNAACIEQTGRRVLIPTREHIQCGTYISTFWEECWGGGGVVVFEDIYIKKTLESIRP